MEKKNKLLHLLSIVLCLTMLFGNISVSAAAQDISVSSSAASEVKSGSDDQEDTSEVSDNTETDKTDAKQSSENISDGDAAGTSVSNDKSSGDDTEKKTSGEKTSEDRSAAASSGAISKSKAVRKAAAADTALDLSKYITGAAIYYVQTVSGSEKTTKIESDTVIPDDVQTFEVTADYANVPSQELHNSHGNTVRYTIPSPLTNPRVTDNTAYDDNVPPQKIGTIKAENGVITIEFTDDHLAGDEHATTSGSFTFRCSVDRENHTENPLTVQFGDVSISLKFQEREIAETGDLSIEKSTPVYIKGTDATSEGYLEYTLTVKTGEDAMPDVRVEDAITTSNSGNFVSGWLVAGTLADNSSVNLTDEEPLSAGSVVTLPNNNGTATINGSNPGSMTWTIGDMNASETRTLTYRIKLNDNYVGLYNKTALTNTATPYAKTYPHTAAQSQFTPHEGASVNKTAGNIIDDTEAGTVTIPYTVEITADANNTWPIRNVKIADNLYNTYQSGNTSTGSEDRKAVCKYAKFQDFKIQAKSASGKKDIAIPKHSNGNPQVHYDTDNEYNPRFDMYVGDVEPGNTQIITYNLVIDKTLFTARSGSWNIKNNITVRTDDEKSTTYGGNTSVGEAQSAKNVGTQVWDRKLSGTQLTEAVTQSPSGKTKKIIPSGAIKYQVVVNEAGQWNVSNATLTDTLGSHLQYTGYLQVDYYSAGTGGTQSITSDADAVRALQSNTLDETVYKDTDDIDNEGHTSLSFTLKGLGLPDKAGAYLLTYYVVPTDTGNVTAFTAKNNFAVSGSVVGPGGSPAVTMEPISVNTSMMVEGGSNFAATKYGWYFDSYANKAYWIIEGTGSSIPKGISLKDVPGSNNNTPELVGAYIGTIDSNKHLQDAYSNFAAFTKSGASSMTELEKGTDYTWTEADGTFTMSSAKTLSENQKLFLIIRTSRSISGTVNKRGDYTLTNKLQLREADSDEFRDVNTASLVTNGGGDGFKELGQVISRDNAGNWKVITGDSSGTGKIITDKATEAGVYIDWRVKLNLYANMSGDYEVTDTLPKGVEAVYVRYFWIDSGLYSDPPTMPQISSLGSEWKDIGLKDTALDGSGSGHKESAYAYYNKSDNTIRFNVGNLKSVARSDSSYSSSKDKKSLEVQIFARVTDEAALAGVEKEFVNKIAVTQGEGNNIAQDTSAVTVKEPSISKSTTGLQNGVVPFTLVVNPLGESLAGGAKTITVEDTLSDPLVYDTTSIKVTDASGNDVRNSVTVQSGGRTSNDKGSILRFIVPNNQKLTITYNTIPYVRPNATFDIRNSASWSGHSGGSSSSGMSGVRNTVSALSTTDRAASIKVTKRDSSDITKLLSGATFTLQEVTWDSDSDAWKDADETALLSAVTGTNGEASFGNLKYNTAYRLTETGAPEGYIADAAPKYIVIAQNTGTDKNNPTYPEAVTAYAEHGATVQYSGWQYSVNVYNTESTSVKVTKSWDDNENQDGKRPNSVTVNLLKNGEKTKSAEINANNNWTYTFDNLPKYENGQEITYTVSEESVTGYEPSIKQTADGFTITNKHTPETTEISGTKTWSDYGQTDKRPEKITIRLLANGTEVQTKTVSADDDWKYSFEDVPKYQNGAEISYTVTEDEVADYSETINGYDITNTYTPGKTSVTVTKKWEDGNNQDGLRPNAVTVSLLADGEATEKTVKLTAANNWTSTFTELDKQKEGKDIQYTVKEGSVSEGYTASVSGDMERGFEITNTHTPETTSVSGKKTWNDADNQDGLRPDSITVNLLKNGTKIASKTVTENDKWSYSFTDLAKNENGTAINYTITEDQVENYSTSISGTNITNSYTPAKTGVTVTKSWNDSNNQDGKRPESVTVSLLADGESTGKTVVLNDANHWSASFTDLDLKKNGTAIKYTVSESQVTGYEEPVITGSMEKGYTITNTHKPETITVSGTKTWNDSDNQDGERPDSITVRLLANGKEVQTAEVTQKENWKYSFTDLPKYDAGTEIVYTVTEDTVEEYTTAVNGYNITNSHTPDETSVTVTKSWQDSDNQDGLRPNAVTVSLLADSKDTGKTVTLNSNNNWSAQFTGLPVNAAGKAIVYTVAEEQVKGYEKPVITGDAKKGFVITNAHTPETVEISGTKTWDDNDDQDGKRPDSITVRLLADGIEKDTQTVSADKSGKWNYTFTNLPKNSGGKQISYTVTEDGVEGYTATKDGYDFTNTHTPDKTSVTVTKNWEDNNNQDGIRPNSVTVRLIADRNDTGRTVTLSDANNWSAEFTDLDVNKNGSPVVYTVSEDQAEGYDVPVITGNASDGYIVTNTHTPETITVAGTKTWDDKDDQDGERPDSITVRLFANGREVQTAEVTQKEDWKYSFTDLPRFEAGTEIVYTVTEDAVKDYTTAVNGYNITNSHTPDETSVTVTKSWQDSDDQDGLRPNAVTVSLLADGEDTGKTVTLNSNNNWSAQFTGLPVNAAGKAIVYTVAEEQVKGYEKPVITGDAKKGFVITNARTPETVEISGTKTWDDNDDQDGKRPDSITVRLLADGKEVRTAKVSEKDGWKYSFSDLPENAAGKKISYNVTEDTVKDYTTTVEGYNITNQYTPEKTSITVTKRWNDENNKDKTRVNSVTVRLLADGKSTGKSITLNADNNWSAQFTGLDVNAGGKAITYTIIEDQITGYEKPAITGDAEKGFIVTNTHTVKSAFKPAKSSSRTSGSGSSDTGSGSLGGSGAKTGDTSAISLYLILFIGAAIVLTALGVARRDQR